MSDAPKISKGKKSAMSLAASLRIAGDALISMADKADALANLAENTAVPEKKRKAEEPKEQKKAKAVKVVEAKAESSSESGSDSDSDSD